jgi:hypothetical protein
MRAMTIGVLLLFFAPVLGPSPTVGAASPTYLRYHHDNPDDALTIRTAPTPVYYKVEYQNAKEYIVSGFYTYYRTEESSSWEGKLEVQDWTSSNLVSYDFSLPKNEVEGKPYYEMFNGPEFMITSNMFSMAMFPHEGETAPVRIFGERIDISVQTHTYQWESVDNQWKPLSSSSPGTTA